MGDLMPLERAYPLQRGSERAMLESMLDFYRVTVVNKVAGLSDEQASTAAARRRPPRQLPDRARWRRRRVISRSAPTARR
jgi:hypothetical protein